MMKWMNKDLDGQRWMVSWMHKDLDRQRQKVDWMNKDLDMNSSVNLDKQEFYGK